jgi:hypothetical protein
VSSIRNSRAAALLTKRAEWDPPTAEEVKKLLKGTAVYSLGAGLGSAAGFAGRRLLLPTILKDLAPWERKVLAATAGAGAGLAAGAALRRLFSETDDERRKR